MFRYYDKVDAFDEMNGIRKCLSLFYTSLTGKLYLPLNWIKIFFASVIVLLIPNQLRQTFVFWFIVNVIVI